MRRQWKQQNTYNYNPIQTKTRTQKIPECSYCGIDDPNSIVQCIDCYRWFCNRTIATESCSHAIYHMTKTKHKRIRLDECSDCLFDIECSLCQCPNVFVLGFIDNKMVCRLPSGCAVNDGLNERPLEWKPIIVEMAQFDDRIVNVLEYSSEQDEDEKQLTIIDINKKEEKFMKKTDKNAYRNLQKISKFNNGKQYRDYFNRLISLEENYTKSEEKNKIDIRWETIFKPEKTITAHFKKDITDSDLDLLLGTELRIKYVGKNETYKSWKGEGVITKVPDEVNQDFGLELEENEDVPTHLRKPFEIDAYWTQISHERMKWAIIEFTRSHQIQSSYIHMKIFGLPIENNNSVNLINLHIGVEDNNLWNASHNINKTFKGFVYDKRYLYTIPNYTLADTKNMTIDVKLPNNKSKLPALNPSQKDAIIYSIKSRLSLIQGPPGTGKTVTAATLVYNLVTNYGEKVLVCAPSNTAVDNLTEKIHRTGIRVVRVLAECREEMECIVSHIALHYIIQEKSKKFKQLYQLKRSGKLKKGMKEYKRYKKLRYILEKQVLDQAQVVCCTCIYAGSMLIRNFKYDSVLIDEASQASEPECLVPIVLNPKRVVLVGDHKQLGPVVRCKPVAIAGLERSLFERLIKDLCITPKLLDIQYRMHPSISRFPSLTFYGNQLKDDMTTYERLMQSGFPWPQSDQRICFYCCKGEEEWSESGTSFLKRNEASLIYQIVCRYFIGNGVKAEQIGIITPYKGQQKYITQYMKYDECPEETLARGSVPIKYKDSTNWKYFEMRSHRLTNSRAGKRSLLSFLVFVLLKGLVFSVTRDV